MYKKKQFRLRPYEQVLEDFLTARRYYPRVERLFLADGDAMCMAADKLLRILDSAREIFPECGRIGIYSRSSNILGKSRGELKSLHDAGLGIVYIGAESGSEEVLRRINKGETPAQIVEAVGMAESAGIAASVTFVSGLGGKELMAEHATKTGRMIGQMGASYVGLLTLILSPGAPMYDDMKAGAFAPLSAFEVIEELDLILTNADCAVDCVLRTNHPSNLVNLRGTLPGDKDRLLAQVRRAKTDGSISDAQLRNRRL
jgi:radical SAM superfamily enzyme YgiQ (UPF0313 family)